MRARLLERDAELRRLRAALDRAGRGHGSVALVSGEAGIGKTSLVRELAAAAPGRVRALVGVCDDLTTPRTLGPLRDMARVAGGPLAAALEAGPDRDRVFDALHRELAGRPRLLVVEDLHWADDATLDVVRWLAWRIPELPCLLVLTYRDDEPGDGAGLRRTLGWPAWTPSASGCGGCRRPPCGSCRRPPARTPARCCRPPAATPSSSARSWPTPTSRCRPPSATPCWPAWRASGTAPGARWSCSRPSPAGSSAGWPSGCWPSTRRPWTRPSGRGRAVAAGPPRPPGGRARGGRPPRAGRGPRGRRRRRLLRGPGPLRPRPALVRPAAGGAAGDRARGERLGPVQPVALRGRRDQGPGGGHRPGPGGAGPGRGHRPAGRGRALAQLPRLGPARPGRPERRRAPAPLGGHRPGRPPLRVRPARLHQPGRGPVPPWPLRRAGRADRGRPGLS